MNAVKAFQVPALQVRIQPAGFAQFAHALSEHMPQLLSALTHRPRGLDTLAQPVRNGLDTSLRELIAAAQATLRDLEPRPPFDPIPPTPKPQPTTHITK